MTAAARVRLVPLAEMHLNATLEWVNDPVLMRLLGRRARVGAEEHRQWFERLNDRRDCQYFAVETLEGDHHVGNVWLWNIDRADEKAEVRILFGDEMSRGRGYGTEALDLLAAVAFTTLKLRRLYAYVFATNPRAKRAFDKAGFRLEGLLRQDRRIADDYVDVYVLARLTSDGEGVP
jgi:RimJ/RimL family protein N-acetyltransferase